MVFNSETTDWFDDASNEESVNPLLQYLQRQSPEVLARVARAVTPDVKQIVSQNVQGLVGSLPGEQFSIQIVTDRENLAGLLASAMMTGYFLRQMEQRMQMEDALHDVASLNDD